MNDKILEQYINLLQIGDTITIRHISIGGLYFNTPCKIININENNVIIDIGIFKYNETLINKSELRLSNGKIMYYVE